LRFCIRPLDGTFVFLATMDIRAHPISFSERPREAGRATRSRMRRRDRFSISSFQLADLGGKANYCYRDQLQTWGGGHPLSGCGLRDARLIAALLESLLRNFQYPVDSPEARFELIRDWFETQVRGWSSGHSIIGKFFNDWRRRADGAPSPKRYAGSVERLSF
jgi:hypothetical protein